MKKNDIWQRLIQFIRDHAFKKGDRLPSERELSRMLDVNRTTLRETLQRMEERGWVITKRGSGIYLNRNAETLENAERLLPVEGDALLKDLLEARLLIAPLIVACAASRVTDHQIKELQQCMVDMSRAIVTKEVPVLIEAETHFYRIIAVMTQNHKLVKIMDELHADGNEFWEYAIRDDAFVNTVIFANYVEIVNALKRNDSHEAVQRVKRSIMTSCEWLSQIKHTRCREIFGIEKT
ncbi:MAG: FadR/GntR family transcriptional regulator [Candidatus Omnitrophota bacterium]